MDDTGTTTITATREQLEAAFRRWEVAHQAGECVPEAETLKLSPDQVARENTDTLIQHLKAVGAGT